jgi:hypothetical protein
MTTKIFITLIPLLTILFSSCDPAIGVAIANKSNKEREIKVIYPENFTFRDDPGAQHAHHRRDSIRTLDLAQKDNYEHPIIIPYSSHDTTLRTYSFTLPANYSAVLESRFLSSLPTFGQVVIIDNKDTVTLLKGGRDFKRRAKLMFGGTWTHTIF